MRKPNKKIERDLPDVERETSRTIHNDQGSTQQMPTDAPHKRGEKADTNAKANHLGPHRKVT